MRKVKTFEEIEIQSFADIQDVDGEIIDNNDG